MTALLEARLSVGYGRVVVARDVHLDLEAGEVCALIGPNGAGKTTLLSTIAGLLSPVSGSVSIAGQPMPPGSARRTNAAGLVLVPDTRALFTKLTTLDNLRAADRSGGVAIDEALELFPLLREKSKLEAGRMSGGEQQMLALARAMVQRPRILMIDEMSMGLAPLVAEGLVRTIRAYATEHAAAVLLVEQHVQVALDASDHAVVLVHGEVALRGPAADIAADPDRLRATYLGRHDGVAGMVQVSSTDPVDEEILRPDRG
jgi:branched-chain amino acid transport system ATP-binding protein